MKLTDHRSSMQFAYAEWQRCHVLYLDMACRQALGGAVSTCAAESIRVDVERAMADLVSMSPQRCGHDDVAIGSKAMATFERAGYGAMPLHDRTNDTPESLTCQPTS